MGTRWEITQGVLSQMLAGKEGGKSAWQQLTEKKKERADENFPLNMRILACTNFDTTIYQLAEKYLLMAAPCEKGTIVEIGTIDRGDDLIDYLARVAPDCSIEGNDMTLLLVETERGKVLASTLFTVGVVGYPKSEEELDVWLNEDDGFLCGPILNAPNDGPTFDRCWGEGDRVSPFEDTENVLCDRFGDVVKTNSLIQMMFSRPVLNDERKQLTIEYALVSVVNKEVVEVLYGIPITLTPDQIIGA